jgi:hypothetical protein
MICPNCNKSNQCPCVNCDPNGDKPNKYLYIDSEDGVVQCSFCDHQFSEGESLDYEWNRMIERLLSEISEDMCIEWFESGRKETAKFSRGDFELAFRYHFKKLPISISGDEWLQIKRNYKIKKLIQ